MVSEQQTVCIVDDEAIIRTSLEMILARSGYHVLSAKSGELALELIENKAPDVAIIDVDLPKMNGCELAKIVSDRHPAVKIVMLTGFFPAEKIFDYLPENLFKFLQKPVDIDILLSTIEDALKENE